MKSAPAGTTRSIHGSSIEVRCPGCAVLVPVASDRHPGFTALLTLKDYLFAAFTGCLRSNLIQHSLAAETPFLVARIMRDGRTDLFATGVYLDRIRDEAGSLRFAERLVVCDSSRFDTLLAIPL